MKPVVFISHGARGTWAERLCHALHEGLIAADFDPRLDLRELKNDAPGENWPAILDTWMCECQAAVMLLNERAAGSIWVQNEASRLHFRRHTDDSLFILPVECGLPPAKLPSFLAQTTPVPQTEWLQADEAEIPGTVARIIATLQEKVRRPLDGADPLAVFFRQIVMRLSGLADEHLVNAAEVLGKQAELSIWHARIARVGRLAAWLIDEPNLGKVGRALGALSLPANVRHEVLDLVAVSQIPHATVADVPKLAADGERVFALHANAVLVGANEPTEWQLRRPFSLTTRPLVEHALRNGGDDESLDEVRAAIEAVIRKHARISDGMPKAVQDGLKARWCSREDAIKIVCTRPVLNDRAAVAAMQTSYGRVVLCLVNGVDQSAFPVCGVCGPEGWALDRYADYNEGLSNLETFSCHEP